MTPTATLVDDLRRAARTRPDHLAVVQEHRRLTYAELLTEASTVAGGLAERGVRRGDRVAVLMRPGVDAVAGLLGAAVAGAAVLALDAATPVPRLAAALALTTPTVLLCDTPAAGRAREAAGPDLPVVVADDPTAWWSVPDLPRRRAVLEVDLAAILLTSGSTGAPRAAAFLHRDLHAVTAAVASSLGLTGGDRILSVLPLAHTYGLSQLLLAVHVGATLVLRPGLTFPGPLVAALAEQRATVLPGVPMLWSVLLPLPGFSGAGLPWLRLLTNAGAALPPPQHRALHAAFPRAAVVPMYGQTECGRVACPASPEAAAAPGSVGVAIPGTEAWVESSPGVRAADDEVGELVVRGPHVMQGYWGDPVATAAKLLPGRLPGDRVLRTGDLFRQAADGTLQFVARRDDVIVTRGEKVAPLEVELVLGTAPGVADVAVLGIPDALTGQCVVAHVSALPGHRLDPAGLRRHCARHLEAAKVPRRVVLHDQLPRLSSGKVDRLALAAGTSWGAEAVPRPRMG